MNGDHEQAAIIEAEGEAEAATLISDALKESGPGVIEVRRIDVSRMMVEFTFQAAREIANTLARAPNVTYLPGGKDQNLLLGIQGIIVCLTV